MARSYKFAVGQRVVLATPRLDRLPVAGTFQVMAQLPEEAGEQQYRIKHDREVFERRVGEWRLSSAAGPDFL